MKSNEKGFTLIEIIVALAVTALITGASFTTVSRVIRDTTYSNDRITAIRQVQNASFWIERDARIAENIVTELPSPSFLSMTWAEQHYNENPPTYHSVTYYFQGLSGGVGQLRRNHWSGAGVNEETVVAQYVYFNPADINGTSKVTYLNPVMTLRLAAVFGQATETKEYRVRRRPNL
ncbi:MAG: prepilin-type N-terminal cleavage/methylation domain-containing protein [Chloroflexi bacterium]|nr:prepilin-type N-terminal cleavage/methylation domain-containing protein [Chloroflexota bacterium]